MLKEGKEGPSAGYSVPGEDLGEAPVPGIRMLLELLPAEIGTAVDQTMELQIVM